MGNSLQGEIDTGAGPAYVVALTKRSVEFSFGRSETFPIGFESVVLEAGLNHIEASQVGRAFDCIRRNSAYLRAWRRSTTIATRGSTAFRDFRIVNGAEIAMELETDSGDFAISVRPAMKFGVFEYSVTDTVLQLQCSSRVADAVLSDAAEEVGAVPDPSSIVSAMILAAETARSDREWIAARLVLVSAEPHSDLNSACDGVRAWLGYLLISANSPLGSHLLAETLHAAGEATGLIGRIASMQF